MERKSTTTIIIYISGFALLLLLLNLADLLRRGELSEQFSSFSSGLLYYEVLFVVWAVSLLLIYKEKIKIGLFMVLGVSFLIGVPTLMINVLGNGRYSFTKIADGSGYLFAFIALLLALSSLIVFVLSIICLINLRKKKREDAESTEG